MHIFGEAAFLAALWHLVSLRFKTPKRTEPKMGFARKASIIFAKALTKTPKLTEPRMDFAGKASIVFSLYGTAP
jgi:hypothetical protein